MCFVGGYSRPRQADPFGVAVPYAQEERVCQGVSSVEVDGRGRLRRETLRAAVASGPNPSYLLGGGGVLYVANEVALGDAESEPGVRAFRVATDATDGGQGGAACAPLLRPLGDPVPTGGGYPCHLELSADGGVLCVSHYGSGSVAGVQVCEGGALGSSCGEVRFVGSGPDAARQEASHAHCVAADPLRPQDALCCDLGADRLHRLAVQPGGVVSGRSEELTTPSGGGPRALAWHPSGRFAYVVLELAAKVAIYKRSEDGGELDTLVGVASTLPSDWPAPDDEPMHSRNGGRWTGSIAVSPNGRYVFVSNRLHDSIARFAVDADSGLLALLGHTPTGGVCPRHFRLCAGGSLLVVAHQHTHSLCAFRVDLATGELEHADCLAEFPNASCVEVLELEL